MARDEVREVEATLQRRVARLLVPAAVGEETVAGITRDEDLTHARVWVGSPEVPQGLELTPLVGGVRAFELDEDGAFAVHAQLANGSAVDADRDNDLLAWISPVLTADALRDTHDPTLATRHVADEDAIPGYASAAGPVELALEAFDPPPSSGLVVAVLDGDARPYAPRIVVAGLEPGPNPIQLSRCNSLETCISDLDDGPLLVEDRFVVQGEEHLYRVRAFDDLGNASATSTPVSAGTPIGLPTFLLQSVQNERLLTWDVPRGVFRLRRLAYLTQTDLGEEEQPTALSVESGSAELPPVFADEADDDSVPFGERIYAEAANPDNSMVWSVRLDALGALGREIMDPLANSDGMAMLGKGGSEPIVVYVDLRGRMKRVELDTAANVERVFTDELPFELEEGVPYALAGDAHATDNQNPVLFYDPVADPPTLWLLNVNNVQAPTARRLYEGALTRDRANAAMSVASRTARPPVRVSGWWTRSSRSVVRAKMGGCTLS